MQVENGADGEAGGNYLKIYRACFLAPISGPPAFLQLAAAAAAAAAKAAAEVIEAAAASKAAAAAAKAAAAAAAAATAAAAAAGTARVECWRMVQMLTYADIC